MNATQTQVKVGDVFLFTTEYCGKPQTGNVSRVTETQFRLTPANGPEVGPFKVEDHYDGKHECKLPRSSAVAYQFSEAKQAQLEASYASDQARLQVKREEQAERNARADARQVAELAEAREAVGGNAGLICRTRSKDTMPDGSRVYVIDLPVKTVHVDRKGGWERIIVRCVDKKEIEWTTGEGAVEKQVVETSYTYLNSSVSSFASCSSNDRQAFDIDGIWQVIKNQYHSW